MLFIPHAAPLREARLRQRRDRFLADVVLEDTGEEAVAYCVNPGRMEAFSRAGARIWLLPAEASERKGGRRLRWTWELIEHEGTVCETNTQRPNYIVRELLERRLLPGLDDWTELASERCLDPAELAVGGGAASSSGGGGGAKDREPTSRLDFWFKGPRGEHFIEVKNCHMVYPDGNGYFPDSISHRASRHMHELACLASKGHNACAIFVIARGDLRGKVRPSEHHDPAFARASREAAASGVAFRAIVVSCSLEGLTVEREVPVDLEPYDLAPIAAWVAANRPTTGWIRSASQQRVANGPFIHEVRALAAERRAARERCKADKPPRARKPGVVSRRRRSAKAAGSVGVAPPRAAFACRLSAARGRRIEASPPRAAFACRLAAAGETIEL